MSNKLSLYSFEAVQPDTRSESTFWSEFYPKLQKYCHFLAQSKWDGDDLAQEAMLKAMTYYTKDKITAALLNKIAHNQWLDLLRKKNVEKLIIEKYHVEGYLPSFDTIGSVDLLLNQFTPQQAIIFFLKEAFQYQSKEIAEILDTTEISVKSSLYRARKRLENQKIQFPSLEPYWEKGQREQLESLLHDSLVNQDPTVLIESIPSIIKNEEIPKAMYRKTIPFNASTPLSTLCMAA
jgi:RNA polymerase sigma factor (sigma-70 family)